MCKKIVLSAVAALLMAAANLNLCCSVLVNGREVPGFYSPIRADICEGTAYEAACELLPDTPELPLVQRHYSLRLRAPESDGAALTDAILRRLESAGCLTVYSVEHSGRLRKFYHITELGRKQLRDFADSWGELEAMYEFIRGGLEDEQS